MKQISLLLLLLTFISCNGQNNSQSSNNNQNSIPISFGTKGDTVKELGNNIMIVFQDSKSNYWFGSWETGVYRYDGENIIQYTTKDGLSHNRIDEIREDKLGNIYFNANGVINKFDGQNFTTLRVSNSVHEWKLEPDDIWFKCNYDSGLVYRYDGKLLHRLTFPPTKLGNEYIAKHPTTHSPYSVYSIYKDTKGNIWFGTNPLGVCRYDGKSINWISEVDVTELHDGPANGVRSIIEDKDGKFWFNASYRYDVIDSANGFNYRREKSIGSLDGEKDGDLVEYMSIARDNNDELWIATYGAGVWRYNGKNIMHYPIEENGKTVNVFSIYKDNQGVLWLGTHEHGVYRFNGKTFARFTVQ